MELWVLSYSLYCGSIATMPHEIGSHCVDTGACRPFSTILVLFTVIEFRAPRVALKLYTTVFWPRTRGERTLKNISILFAIVSNQRASEYLKTIRDESASHWTADDKENGAAGSIVSDQWAFVLIRHSLQCNDTGRRTTSSEFRRRIKRNKI
jgi:hypothetical protein